MNAPGITLNDAKLWGKFWQKCILGRSEIDRDWSENALNALGPNDALGPSDANCRVSLIVVGSRKMLAVRALEFGQGLSWSVTKCYKACLPEKFCREGKEVALEMDRDWPEFCRKGFEMDREWPENCVGRGRGL